MPLSELSDRSVIVVGAGGGGIGTAICHAAAEAGARVVAVDRDPERLARTTERLAEAGLAERLDERICDASDADAIAALVGDVSDGTPPLHGLVNVAGGLPIERWTSLADDDGTQFEAVFESNLHIALRSARPFARAIRARGEGGSLVHIATIAALQAMPFGAGYAAAKAALLSAMRTMALEWGRFGLRVNAVAPGSILVPRNQGGEDPERDRATIPLGRRGTPEDIADAVVFLLSERARWITGQTLAVDGGSSIKPSYLDADGLPVFVRDEVLRRRLLGDD